MDAFEAQVLHENQNETRRRVLAHLQAAVREIKGYQRVELLIDEDLVTIIYENGSTKRVNIGGDSELAMLLDVVKKILY